MKKRRLFLPIALILICISLMLILVGCTGGSSSNNDGATGDSGGTVTPDNPTTPEEPVEPEEPEEPEEPKDPVVPEEPECVHSWQDATCLLPKTCALCGEISGRALGHEYNTVERTMPTCEKGGIDIYICTRIGCEDCTLHIREDMDYFSETCRACNHSYMTDGSIDDTLKATGHSDFVWIPVVDDGKIICEAGGQMIYVCKVCLETDDPECKNCVDMVADSEMFDATGHIAASDWTIGQEPTLNSAGYITGYCSKCELDGMTVTLPAFNKSAYSYVHHEAPTCLEIGYDEYTFVNNGWSHTFVVSTVPGYHRLNGVKMNKKVYTVNDNVEPSGNYVPTCAEEGLGVYTCDNCATKQIVTMKGLCDKSAYLLDITRSYPPTCCTRGLDMYFCPVCNTTDKRYIDKLPHAWEATELLDADEKPLKNLNVPSETPPAPAKIKFTCTNADCDVNYPNATGNPYTMICEIIEYNTVYIRPECGVDGSLTYNITYKDRSNSNILTKGEFVVTLDAYDHVYRISDYKVIEFKPNTYRYTYSEIVSIFGTDLEAGGFTMSGNFPADCQSWGYGVTRCHDCDSAIILDVMGDHAPDEGIYYPVTCETPECTLYTCTVPGCGKIMQQEIHSPALGHDYGYEITLRPTETETGILHVWCNRADCGCDKELTLPVLGEWEATYGSGTVCTNGNYTRYTYFDFVIEDNEGGNNDVDVVIFFTVYDGEAANHNNSETYASWIDEKGEYEYTAYYCPNCNSFVITSIVKVRGQSAD